MANWQAARDIDKIIKMLNSNDVNRWASGTRKFRKISCRAIKYDKVQLIQGGLVSKLVKFLQMDNYPDLQLDACWSLTNIAAGTTTETKLVVKAGAVPMLIKLICCNAQDLQEQAVWALGNIICDCTKYRDLALKKGIMVPLLRFLWKSQETSSTRIAVWTLANLCRPNKSALDYEKLSPCLPVLSCMLFHSDLHILVYACKALASFSLGGKIGLVIGAGGCRRLIELLIHQRVTSFALKILSSIIASDHAEYTQIFIDHSILPKLLALLSTSHDHTRKYICQIISYMATGNCDQKQAIIDSGIVPILIKIVETGGATTSKSAAFAVTKLCGWPALPEQLKYVMKHGFIPLFLHVITCKDILAIELVLLRLSLILCFGQLEAVLNGGNNSYAEMVRKSKALEKIVNLKNHSNGDVRNSANDLVKWFFS